MSVLTAQNELYELLKQRFKKILIGISVEKSDGEYFIVLYFSRKLTQKIIDNLPKKYNEYKVYIEVSESAMAL